MNTDRRYRISISDDTDDGSTDLYIEGNDDGLSFNFENNVNAAAFQRDFEALLERHRIDPLGRQFAAQGMVRTNSNRSDPTDLRDARLPHRENRGSVARNWA